MRQQRNSTLLFLGAELDPYNGPWGDAQITHLLRRTMFGVRKEDLDMFRNLSLTEAVDQLLQLSPTPDPPVNDYYEEIEDPELDQGETWVGLPYPDSDDIAALRIESLKGWLLFNQIQQDANIHEKMIYFWHNHLALQVFGVFNPQYCFDYFDLLRKSALGNFRQLMKDITLDRAMMDFLNLQYSSAEEPDENYARELQELFCIGKGPNSHYTEQDVQAAARALTGWRVDWDTDEVYFEEDEHDPNDKTFSAFYNNKVITGKSGQAGKQELDELLDMIFENEELSHFICRKIYSFFVRPDITPEVEQQVIAPLATIFRDNNYEIKPVLQTLLLSDHFFSEVNRGAMIKSPLDFLITHMRQFDMTPSSNRSIADVFFLKRSVSWSVGGIGQDFGDPPNVAGWQAFYQLPQLDKFWINTGTIITRTELTDSSLYWGFWSDQERFAVYADIIGFVQKLDAPSDPMAVIDETSQLLLGTEISAQQRERLRSILLSNQQDNYYWANAWVEFMEEPDNEEKRSVVENRLKWFFQNITQMGEFQLM